MFTSIRNWMMDFESEYKLKSSISLQIALLLLLYPLWALAQQDDVSARLDRNQIIIGETVTLSIELQGNSNRLAPDLTVLNEKFSILNRSTQSQISIVNGQQQTSTRIDIILEPQEVGDLLIPRLTVGNQQTDAIALSVKPAPEISSDNAGHSTPDVFLEVEITPENPYVQSQVNILVRLLIGVQLNEASLSEPELKDAEVRKLGDDVQYSAERSGRRYQVIERRYAVFPQRSGTFEIPPVVLSARISTGNTSRFFSRSNGRRITRSSEALQIDVKPVPANYTGVDWLPVRELQLREIGFDQSAQYRVGEPLTRTIELTAQGLTDAALPDINMNSPDGARVYADKPIAETREQEQWVLGRRTIKQAIVPTTTGTLLLPEINLDWWDTKSNQQRQSIIPAKSITILPALDEDNQPLPLPVQTSDLNGSSEFNARLSETIPTVSTPGIWPYLSAALAILWLMSTALWWRERNAKRQVQAVEQRFQESREISIVAARKACEKSCRENRPNETVTALIGWAHALSPNTSINNLGEVIANIDASPELRQALQKLENACYGRFLIFARLVVTLDWHQYLL